MSTSVAEHFRGFRDGSVYYYENIPFDELFPNMDPPQLPTRLATILNNNCGPDGFAEADLNRNLFFMQQVFPTEITATLVRISWDDVAIQPSSVQLLRDGQVIATGQVSRGDVSIVLPHQGPGTRYSVRAISGPSQQVDSQSFSVPAQPAQVNESQQSDGNENEDEEIDTMTILIAAGAGAVLALCAGFTACAFFSGRAEKTHQMDVAKMTIASQKQMGGDRQAYVSANRNSIPPALPNAAMPKKGALMRRQSNSGMSGSGVNQQLIHHQHNESGNEPSVSASSLTQNRLPAGWIALRDDEGHQYYYNQTTKESSWDMPTQGSATGSSV